MFGIVSERNGLNGLAVVDLTSNDGNSRCEVYLHGGTVTSWICEGEERLFLSNQAVFDGKRPIRGGIPIVFPQFSQPNPAIPQHGVARTSTWKFVGSQIHETEVSAIFSLEDNEFTRSFWNHKFTLLYKVTLQLFSLKSELMIVNSGVEAFDFHCLLHTYLSVPHIDTASVSGLSTHKYVDKLNNSVVVDEQESEILFSEEVDRVYLPNVGSGVQHFRLLDNTKNVELLKISSEAKTKQLLQQFDDISMHLDDTWSDSHPTDVVVWNAWIAKCKSIADLPDDAYLKYVCIEPGLVSKLHNLLPNHAYVLTQILQLRN